MRVREREDDFIENKFAMYYEDALNSKTIALPSLWEQREFGFIPFREKIMIRHKSFRTPEEFQYFMTTFTPAHAYYSAAYYNRPKEAMDKKGWLGADLIFDIDSDHIETPCKGKHEYWRCEKCQNAITQRSKLCPTCRGTGLKAEAWLCDTCLEVAKAETIKLLDFLMADFGFQQKEIEICFSGHRGYHVHVVSKTVTLLDQTARKEIVDYILGTGLKMEYHGLAETPQKRHRRMLGPSLDDEGWRGRIAKGIYDFLQASTAQQLKQISGLDAAKKDLIIEVWNKREPWSMQEIKPDIWRELAVYGVNKRGSKIDTVVTTDLHRLIRMPNTLHGKTGLKVVRIPLNSLEKFDPLQDAIAFPRDSVSIYVNEAHEFRLRKETFGPFNHQAAELPLAAGIYLLSKNAATLT